MLRDEAEREFRTARLDKLKSRWTFWSCVDERRARYGTTFDVEHVLQTGTVKRLSDDMSLAYYSLELVTDGWGSDEDDVDAIFNHGIIDQVPFVTEAMLDCVGWSEKTYQNRLGRFSPNDISHMKQRPLAISSGLEGSSGWYPASSEVPWKSLDLRNREISIDWKRLLGDALADKHVLVQSWD